MRPVSTAMQAYIQRTGRTFKAKLAVGTTEYDNIISLKWAALLTDGSDLTIGCTPSACVDVRIHYEGVTIFKGCEVTVFIGAELSSGDEWVEIGTFTAEKPTKKDGVISFTAYDAMSGMTGIYETRLNENAATVGDVYNEICTQARVLCVALSSGDANLVIAPGVLNGCTHREALGYIAGYLGANAVINRNGKVQIVKLPAAATGIDDIISVNNSDYPELEEENYVLGYMNAYLNEGDESYYTIGDGVRGFSFVCPLMTQSRLEVIGNQMLGLTYRVAKAKMLSGDIRIEPGDVLNFPYNSETLRLPVMSITMDFDGGVITEPEALGRAQTDEDYNTSLQKRIAAAYRKSVEAMEVANSVSGAVTNVDVLYAQNYSPTDAPENEEDWSTVAPVWLSGMYMWQKTVTTYADGSVGESEPTCITGARGPVGATGNPGKSIGSITNYYLASPLATGVSNFNGPWGDWSTTVPALDAANRYLWNYEKISYTTPSTPTITDARIICIYSTDGADGRGIASIAEKYKLSTENTGVLNTDGDWLDTAPTLTPTNKYLWCYEEITYTDSETPVKTQARIIGVYGDTGDSARSLDLYAGRYAVAYNSNGTAKDSTAITLTAIQQNFSDTVTWSSSPSVTLTAVSGQPLQKKLAVSSFNSNQEIKVTVTAGGLTDTITIVKVTDGANGTDGTDGADAYTVVLSNESHTFAGGVSAALSGSTACDVIAYKGATRVAATIGSISGQPTGMSTTISNNGTISAKFTVTVSTLMITKNGVLTVPITVDGKTFTKYFTYSLALSGVSITSVENYYLATSSSTGILNTNTDFTTAVQNVTATNKYLWNYEKINYSNGTFAKTEACIIGAYGNTGSSGSPGSPGTDGRGITSITEYYARSASNSSAPSTSSFSTTVPMLTSYYKYLWNYEEITYTAGANTTTTKRVIGVYGDTGATGATGKGVSSIVEEYYLSTSNTSQTGGSWQTTCPTWVSGKYIWTRSYITWSDGTTSTTAPTLANAINSANEKATAVENALTTAVTALNKSLTNSMGYYQTSQTVNGATITYMHNKSTLATSTYICKITGSGIGWATSWGGSDANTVWQAGIYNGTNLIMDTISTHKITAGMIDVDDLSALNATIGGIQINQNHIQTIGYNANGTTGFKLTSGGQLYANDVDLKGSITATGGTIGGININENALYSFYRVGNGYPYVCFSTYFRGDLTESGSTLSDGVVFGITSFDQYSATSYGNTQTKFYINYLGNIYTTGTLNVADTAILCGVESTSYNNYCSVLRPTVNAGDILVSTPGCYSGDINHRWKCLYTVGVNYTGSLNSSSDLRVKNTVTPLESDARYDEFFNALVPVSYKLNLDTSNRLHFGYIVQDVITALEQADLTPGEYGIYSEEYDEQAQESRYYLSYNDFIALNTKMIQSCMSKIASLEAEIKELSNGK